MPDYATTKDEYGADVTVRESSAAMIEGEDRGPWVWIFIQGGPLKEGRNDGSAHLNPEQARKVRDALTEWLESV